MPAGRLDLNVHARRQAQLVQRLDRLGRRLHDVDQPLVRADLELLAGLLVHVRAGQDRVALDARRQGNRTVDDRTGPLGRIDDLRRALIQNGVIVRLHADADGFARMTCHGRPPVLRNPYLPSSFRPIAGNFKSYRLGFRPSTSPGGNFSRNRGNAAAAADVIPGNRRFLREGLGIRDWGLGISEAPPSPPAATGGNCIARGLNSHRPPPVGLGRKPGFCRGGALPLSPEGGVKTRPTQCFRPARNVGRVLARSLQFPKAGYTPKALERLP